MTRLPEESILKILYHLKKHSLGINPKYINGRCNFNINLQLYPYVLSRINILPSLLYPAEGGTNYSNQSLLYCENRSLQICNKEVCTKMEGNYVSPLESIRPLNVQYA